MFQRQESWKEGTKGSEGEQERGPGEKHFGFLKTVIMGNYQIYITVEDGCNELPGSHHPSSMPSPLLCCLGGHQGLKSMHPTKFLGPGNLDSSLCFIQPSISHDVLCIEVK